MRRKDREMNEEFGIQIIDKADYGIISMVSDNKEPYGVPLSIARHKDNLYFHSAKDGKKVKILENNPSVSIVFVGEVKVPDMYTKEQLDEIARDETKAALFTSKIFTTEFESVIVKGKAKLIEDEAERIKAMKVICEKYTPTKMDYFDIAVKSGLKRTNLYKVKISEIKSKRKKYDIHGEEMKWGRME